MGGQGERPIKTRVYNNLKLLGLSPRMVYPQANKGFAVGIDRPNNH